uniref:Secreted protein n=1 Tax=Oryza brachyantha TaxID=4533 RepID=J3MMQ1_ORYBR
MGHFMAMVLFTSPLSHVSMLRPLISPTLAQHPLRDNTTNASSSKDEVLDTREDDALATNNSLVSRTTTTHFPLHASITE